jgi:hypothetical protein
MKKREIIIFHWVDASMHGTDQKTREEWKKSQLIEGIVAGHIVNETKEMFTIAMDLFFAGQPDIEDDNYRQVACYPKSGIRKIIKRFKIETI